MPDAAADDLLTPQQVAKLLSVTEETVRTYAKTGRLTYIQLPSGRRRYRRSDIDAILEPKVAEVVE